MPEGCPAPAPGCPPPAPHRWTRTGIRYEKPYWAVPSAKAQRIQAQLEKYEGAKVLDIEAALNDAAQVNLIGVQHRLVSVQAPEWLHINEQRTQVVAPKPNFENLE